jgi:hypothetical protein
VENNKSGQFLVVLYRAALGDVTSFFGITIALPVIA